MPVKPRKTGRTYLVVPFEDNDRVSALGAKFDGRRWYVPARVGDDAFARWFIAAPVIVVDPDCPVPVQVFPYQEPPRRGRR